MYRLHLAIRWHLKSTNKILQPPSKHEQMSSACQCLCNLMHIYIQVSFLILKFINFYDFISVDIHCKIALYLIIEMTNLTRISLRLLKVVFALVQSNVVLHWLPFTPLFCLSLLIFWHLFLFLFVLKLRLTSCFVSAVLNK